MSYRECRCLSSSPFQHPSKSSFLSVWAGTREEERVSLLLVR